VPRQALGDPIEGERGVLDAERDPELGAELLGDEARNARSARTLASSESSKPYPSISKVRSPPTSFRRPATVSEATIRPLLRTAMRWQSSSASNM